MTAQDVYPQPQRDEDNGVFLSGWRDGKLMLQQSASGGPLFFYPRPICPYTGSRDLVWREASGSGRIISFSLVRRPNHPSFDNEVPIILAEIELDEGARMLGRIICDEISSVKSNARVETLKLPEAARFPLPAFRLAS